MQLSNQVTNTRIKAQKEGLAASPGLWSRSARKDKLEATNHPVRLPVPTNELLAFGNVVFQLLYVYKSKKPAWTGEAKIFQPQILDGKASTLQF